MKFPLLFLFILIISCATQKKVESTESFMVGTWEGNQTDSCDGSLWWRLERYKNGEYLIKFYSDDKRSTLILSETGKWWVEDDLYYSINSKIMSMPDVYEFKVINQKKISYVVLSMDKTGNCITPYVFTDRRVE